MLPFRVIVIVDGTRAKSLLVPFERAPRVGERLELPDGALVSVRHVIDAARAGIAGLVLTSPAESDVAAEPCLDEESVTVPQT
jgi:hypothetical protein